MFQVPQQRAGNHLVVIEAALHYTFFPTATTKFYLIYSTQCLDRCRWSVGVMNATICDMSSYVATIRGGPCLSILARCYQARIIVGPKGGMSRLTHLPQNQNSLTTCSPTLASSPCIIISMKTQDVPDEHGWWQWSWPWGFGWFTSKTQTVRIHRLLFRSSTTSCMSPAQEGATPPTLMHAVRPELAVVLSAIAGRLLLYIRGG